MAEATGPSPAAAAWFDRFRAACAEIGAQTRAMSPSERSRVVGDGAGGDRTVAIDQIAEDLLVAELEPAAREHGGATLVSEEVGRASLCGGGEPFLVVDPIDGSLNAKRGVPYFATSVAVADGPEMGSVYLGFVHDYATGNEFIAERGRGAWLNGARLPSVNADRELRIVAVEGAYPHRMAAAAIALHGVRRLRMFGALAISLCTVAAGWVDGMVGLGGARSVDVAAGQLIARECGVTVSTPGGGPLEGYPLDVTTNRSIAACVNPLHSEWLARAVDAARAADA
jgi:myo-inositol-1(or 4)-monophosphatase